MSGGDTVTDAVIGGAAEGGVGDAIHASKRKKNQPDADWDDPLDGWEAPEWEEDQPPRSTRERRPPRHREPGADSDFDPDPWV